LVLQANIHILRIGDTTYDLRPGDSSTLAHTYRNPGRDTTRLIWVNTPPTF
jgi:hypothetical protein